MKILKHFSTQYKKIIVKFFDEYLESC